ncbi:hypothetical protein T484DRAFT_1968521 [Baffinella frigidus]|nr:hypothetical protein T484DRAFT_1968521 [Cryptophyta sp. CCMP2293]
MGRMALALALAAAGVATSDGARSLAAFGSFSPVGVQWQVGTAGRVMQPRGRRGVGTLRLSGSANQDVGGEAQPLSAPIGGALRSEAGVQRVVPELVDDSSTELGMRSSVLAQVKGTFRSKGKLSRSATWITVLAGVLDGMGMLTSIASGSALLSAFALFDVALPSIPFLAFMMVCGISCLATSFAVAASATIGFLAMADVVRSFAQTRPALPPPVGASQFLGVGPDESQS